MAYIRKRLGRWQSVVRVKGYPARTQSFNYKSDARLWSSNIELELYREEHGLRKNKYPTFRECFKRYRDSFFIFSILRLFVLSKMKLQAHHN